MTADRRFSPLPHRQRGRTIVELMVVVALGLVILLGVGTLYLTADRSAQEAERGAVIEDSGRVALRIIGDAARRSRYSEIVSTNSLPSNAVLYGSGGAVLLRGCTGQRFSTDEPPECTAVAGAVGDALLVGYQANNVLASTQGPAARDCLGNTAPNLATTEAISSLGFPTVPVARNIFYLAGNNLMCLGNGNATPQAIVGDVTDFRVFFGYDDRVKTALPGVGAASLATPPQATSLRTAAYIDAQSGVGDVPAWNWVVSAVVCLELRGPPNSATAGEQYQPCPRENSTTRLVEETDPIAVPDTRLRRTYTQTFAIRSLRASTLAVNRE
ncbi:MAG: PilW family protein [Betaproteobacteria bacterium]